MKNDVASKRNVSKEFLFKSSAFSLAFQPWPGNCILKRFQAIFLDFMANWEKLYSEFYTPKMHHHFLLGLRAVTNSEDKVPVIGIVTLPRIPFKHSLAYSKTIKAFHPYPHCQTYCSASIIFIEPTPISFQGAQG